MPLLSVVNSIGGVCIPTFFGRERKSVNSICGYEPEQQKKNRKKRFMKNEFSHLFTTSVFTFLSKSFLKKFWVAFLVSNSFEFVVLAMNERGERGNLIPLWRSYDSPFVTSYFKRRHSNFSFQKLLTFLVSLLLNCCRLPRSSSAFSFD